MSQLSIRIHVIAIVFCICFFPVTTFAQDTATVTHDDGSIETLPAQRTGGRVLSDIYGSFGLTGVYFEDGDRGDESDRESGSIIAIGNVRKHVGDFLNTRQELGLYVRGDWTDYAVTGGKRYSGEIGQVGGGLEWEMRDKPATGGTPLWAFNQRLGLLYRNSVGRDGRLNPFLPGRYRATQESLMLHLESRLEVFAPFYDSMWNHSLYTVVDGDAVVETITGFMPKISLWGEFKYQLHTSRRTLVTRLGGYDRQRESEMNYAARFHFWRWANDTLDTRKEWLHEFMPHVVVGGSWRYAAGYESIRNAHSVYDWYIGAGAEYTLNKHLSVSVEGRYHNEVHTSRDSFSAVLSVRYDFW